MTTDWGLTEWLGAFASFMVVWRLLAPTLRKLAALTTTEKDDDLINRVGDVLETIAGGVERVQQVPGIRQVSMVPKAPPKEDKPTLKP